MAFLARKSDAKIIPRLRPVDSSEPYLGCFPVMDLAAEALPPPNYTKNRRDAVWRLIEISAKLLRRLFDAKIGCRGQHPAMSLPDQDTILNAIRSCASSLGRPPSRAEFMTSAGMTEYQVLRHFPSWREAVRAAGLEPHSTNQPLSVETLLEDWGEVVRQMRRIPTRHQYRKAGNYSLGVFDKRIGSWAAIPPRFRQWASEHPRWADVVALLPLENGRPEQKIVPALEEPPLASLKPTHQRLPSRPTYGNPIDFRGLRHEPINENGVVFLFGMVARELGYSVEAVQAGYPDCEAKRQVGPGKWQSVRIEFEFESRNSVTTDTRWTVATSSYAGDTTGPIVHRIWRCSI
jgi:Homing endonuclease associated repeat